MESATASDALPLSDDERRLAELGYRQDLKRGWSSFSNFAISAGPFTTFSQAWNNGGPVAISIGWPVISVFVLMVGFSMAELASAYPTSGGIYYWAYKLGGVRWAWFTGWFNLIGLIAIVASVDYACATFLNALLGLYGLHFIFSFATTSVQSSLDHVFALFAVILFLHGIFNVFSSPLVSLFNRISVWWHVLGVAAIVAGAAALLCLLVLAIPFFSMRLAFTDAGNDPTSLTTRQAYDLLAQGFGPGFNGPLVVAVATAALPYLSRMVQRTIETAVGH